VEGSAPAGQTIPVSEVALPSRLIISGVDFEPNVISSRAPFTAASESLTRKDTS
jgi:hypothetical protein